jgi:hypothetical protein
VLRNVVAAMGERRWHVAHRNSSRAGVADVDRLYMDARSLNQAQTRRCIDYLSRYRHASDQEDVRIVHLSRKWPRRVKLVDCELGPEHARDHVFDRQARPRLLNLPCLAHDVVQDAKTQRPSSINHPQIGKFETRNPKYIQMVEIIKFQTSSLRI